MNRYPLALAMTVLAALSSAQVSLQDFLAARSQNGVKAPIDSSAYRDFIGTAVFEVRCTVKGYISSRGDTLMVETTDGLRLNVHAETAPDFLKVTGTAARLLVRLSRPNSNSETQADLLVAADDGPITDYDNAKALAKGPRQKGSSTSRSMDRGGRYPAPSTGSPTLTGQIGSGVGSVVDITPSPVKPTGDLGTVVDAYGSYIQSINPKIDRATANTWAGYIIQYNNEVGLDPRLQIALIVAESDFRPECTSNKGAIGLTQLMSDEIRRYGLTNGYDPRQNIWASTRLLREGIDKYKALGFDDWKSIVLALAGYNAGHGAVKKYGYSVPPYRETEGYVNRITKLYKKFVGSE